MRIVGSRLLAAAAIIVTASANADEGSALLAVHKEAKVSSADWRGDPGSRVLLVRMDNDGSRRDGFAEYLCSIVRDHQAANGVMVKIIDSRVWNARKEEIDIGAALCPA